MTYVWPTEDGWPYPDSGPEQIDLEGSVDDDLLSIALESHLLDALDPLEREVITGRFGLAGAPIRSMKQLHTELGIPRADLRQALGSGLAKLRTHLTL